MSAAIVPRLRMVASTVARMKPGQVFRRLGRTVGLKCSVGCGVKGFTADTRPLRPFPELDLDPVFLARFSAEELMRNTFSFLHAAHHLDPDGVWELKEETPLWNFNLHYFEFLFPLWNAYRESGERKYLDRAAELIRCWIRRNPLSGKGNGWAAYTVSLRATNWLGFLALAGKDLPADFWALASASLYEQYEYLSMHLEKDILGNHYFENLKALVLCAVFFRDDRMLDCAVKAFRKECREEILPDGMHFELSPMYHNLILEGLMKAAAVLRDIGRPDPELEALIQPMLDAAWSLEEGLERLPLFNDAGNNVAKSLEALAFAAGRMFGLKPEMKKQFPDAGYYIFRKDDWKLIVDAGQPGPSYIPGHAHCDALSFELYRGGIPIVMNCGTYAYQTEQRSFFRSTAAHNTVMINGTEQSQCWGVFRMGKRSSVRVLEADEKRLIAEMKDQNGRIVKRTFSFGQELVITDETEYGKLTGFVHPITGLEIGCECEREENLVHPYAPEYGIMTNIRCIKYEGEGRISLRIPLEG